MPAYGITTSDIETHVVKALGMEKSAIGKVWPYLSERTRSADRIGHVEREKLLDYLYEHGYGHVPLEKVIVVQFTYRELQDSVFHYPQSVKNAIDALCEEGVADRVFTGFKGHGTLLFLGFKNSSIKRDDLSEYTEGEGQGSLKEKQTSAQKMEGIHSIQRRITWENGYSSNLIQRHQDGAAKNMIQENSVICECGNSEIVCTARENVVECFCPVCTRVWAIGTSKNK